VKLLNTTCYSTRDLKKIFTRIANEELQPEKAKRVKFKIVYSKEGRHTGCAYVGGTHGTIRLPKPPHKLDMAQVALVIGHEIGHLRGLRHGSAMHCARYSWTHGDYRTFYAWANEIPIAIKESKAKPAPPKVDSKLAHAVKMLEKNEAKLKRTQALVKKWSAKVKYYQKRAELTTYEGKRSVLLMAACKDAKILSAES
jgi:hypothetical protein